MRAGKAVVAVAVVACFSLGAVAVSHAGVGSLVFLLERAWQQRDGGGVSFVHTAIVELMVLAPEDVMRWLHMREEIRADLIGHWQHAVFTDYRGTKTVDLQTMKRRAIQAVDSCACVGEEMQMLKKRLLEAFASISIRRID